MKTTKSGPGFDNIVGYSQPDRKIYVQCARKLPKMNLPEAIFEAGARRGLEGRRGSCEDDDSEDRP